jgi:penicillin-binding protein 1A
MTLTQALIRSINTIAVKLSIFIGDGNAKRGRAEIVKTARAMGLRTALPDTPSLPIGADEVTVFDHVGAYATFPNLGKAVTPHAVLEVRTGAGDPVWRWDRDGKKPRQVMRPDVAQNMIFMMNKVVEEGTARRAMLTGIKAAGKTGTTNAYRDAWFMGYTGNFVCGVWFGNDDYTPTNRMTGGSLPAMTWHEIMAYAHQGLEIKPLPGLGGSTHPRAPVVSEASPTDAIPRPVQLSRRAADVLVRLEQRMEGASRALATVPPAAPQRGAASERDGTVAAADRNAPARGE